jgi:hypothetical protein
MVSIEEEETRMQASAKERPWRDMGKMIFLKSKLKVPEDTNFTDTLGLDVWPSDL